MKDVDVNWSVLQLFTSLSQTIFGYYRPCVLVLIWQFIPIMWLSTFGQGITFPCQLCNLHASLDHVYCTARKHFVSTNSLIWLILNITVPLFCRDNNIVLTIGTMYFWKRHVNVWYGDIDGLAQDCSYSSASIIELLQSCTKSSILTFWHIITDAHLLGHHNLMTCKDSFKRYRIVSNIRGTLVGNKIVDHSDVVGASPVGAVPIGILCGYAIRSGRHPEGSQRPPGRPQVGPGRWLPEGCLPDRIA